VTPRHGYDEHGGWDALATAYALSALEPDEEAPFVSHLAGCARCTETVREATRTVGDLAYAMPDEVPPPGLKQRLMTAVARAPRGAVPPWTGRAERGAGEEGPEAPPAGPAVAGPAVAGPAVTGPAPAGHGAPGAWTGPRPHAGPDGERGADTDVRSARRPRRWPRIAAAAALLAAVAGLTAWNVTLRSEQHRLRDAVAQREAVINELTQEGPVRIAVMEGKSTRIATLVVRPGGIEVISEAMRPNGAQTTYWVWALTSLTDPKPVPIAGFDVRADRLSVRTVRSSQPGLDRVADFAVSVEPSGITPTRPSTVLAAGAAVG